jgi:hypothetical protein
MDLGRTLVEIEHRLGRVENQARLSHASIDDTSLEVRDGTGSLRGLLGMQADGTTAVNVVNGPPPPQPTAPVVASVLGGVTVTWDATFTGGALLPLDWQRVEVHASTTTGFTPTPDTLKGTIETPQGATVVVVTDDPVYLRLMARSTSGTASTPSAQTGPAGPTPVVADDIADGIVTEVKLANDAVTAAKIAAGAVGTTELADAAVHAQQLADAAVEVAKIAANAVTGPAIATDAVTATKIAANAVTAVKIAANSVTAAKVAAGAITTDKLTVTGGANILTDPSFEGAYTAALVAGSTFATQDATAGNGSPTSLKIDATSGSPVFRSVALTSVATLPGEKWHVGVDYWVSADWVGTEISIHARWETATGAVISYGKAVTTTPVREGWTRLEATVTAPATTARIVPRVESGSGTAGFVRFDNATMRPVLGGTQIQDGAITTEKIVAGAILAGQIAAGAVLTDKLAAEAVTAAKIAALTITADKIAANAITVGKIAAGAVDATAIAADAITGKTITGGTITGTTITGGTLQTATSGQRITLNEGGFNKILVYSTGGTAIGELSSQGLLVKGTNGSVLWLDPNHTYPNLRLTNAAATNSAVINVVEGTPGSADLGLNSGTFTASGYTDIKWRTFFGNDFWVTERVRSGDLNFTLGGRLYLGASQANLGFRNSTDPTLETVLTLSSGVTQISGGPLELLPRASGFGALSVLAAAGHTGILFRLRLDSSDKFLVDKDGNVTIAGIGQRQTKRRTSDATRTNTNTPTTDTQITFTVDANSNYIFDGFMKYSGPGDFQMGWTVPAGTNGEWSGIGNGSTVVSGTGGGGTQQDVVSTWGYTQRTESTDIAATRTYGGISTNVYTVHVRGTLRVGATGGTFALQWAQGAVNATATTLYLDSHVRLEKVA